MRLIAAPALAILQGAAFDIHTIAEVRNVDGTWVDVSGRFIAADLTVDVDQSTWLATLTFMRDDPANAASLSPLRSDSTLNVDDSDVYAPLLTAGNQFRLNVACMAPGDAPDSGDYHELLTGTFDTPAFAGPRMTMVGRDLGGMLVDTTISERRTYGDPDAPIAVADVMQQILDDVLGSGVVTLEVIDASDFVVTDYTPLNVPVMEAMQALAIKAGGLVVRYRYADDGVMKLSLYDPVRDKTAPDVTLTPSRYIEIPQASLDITNLRNTFRAQIIDPVTGELLTLPDVVDTDSVAAFGPRFMQLAGDVLAGLTANQAIEVLEAARDDLSTPKFDHQVTRLLFWPAELGDLVLWSANDVHYNDDQPLAVVGLAHHLERGHGTTTFTCRGKPAGAYNDWIRRQGTGPTGPLQPPAPELLFALAEATQFGGTADTVDGGLWIGYRMPVGVDEIRIHAVLGDGENLPVPELEASTYAMTVRRPEGDIGSIRVPNERVVPGQPGEYASMVLLSTRSTGPAKWKRVSIVGVRGGLTSVPVTTPRGVEMVDPNPTRIDGELVVNSVVRSGSTNTVTVTPTLLESTDDTVNGNWVVIKRNSHYLPAIFVKDSLDPVVFLDTGLPESADYEAVYEAFIWNGGQSGPKRRYGSGVPTIETPQWALGTPMPAIVATAPRIQLSWTASTPGATGVRVEATIDGVNVRTVGAGALASGTVYDTDTGVKRYRLVATNGATVIAVTPWKWSTGLPPTISNPSAVPQILAGYPKPIMELGDGFFDPQFLLEIRWRCATPNAKWIRVQESDDNGVGDPWALSTDGETASVATGVWRSPDATALSADRYYRLQALALDGTTVLATSPVVHYVPASA